MQTYNVTLPNKTVIKLTAAELLKFHDDLTTLVNDHYPALTKEADEDND